MSYKRGKDRDECEVPFGKQVKMVNDVRLMNEGNRQSSEDFGSRI